MLLAAGGGGFFSSAPPQQPDNRYLFEGDLTVQEESPPPSWLIIQLTAMSLEATLGESSVSNEYKEFTEGLINQLVRLMTKEVDIQIDLQ